MMKKIFTLSLIASILLCNTLNSLEFKIKNKSKKPIFFRFFEKKDDIITPPLNNFTLLTLDKGQEKNYTFKGKLYFCLSYTDTISNKLKVMLFQFAPGKNINLWVDNTDLFSKTSGPLKEGYVSSNDFTGIPIDIQKNERGKWSFPNLIDMPKEKINIQKPVEPLLEEIKEEVKEEVKIEKPVIHKPIIIEDDQPSPQEIKIIEQLSYL